MNRTIFFKSAAWVSLTFLLSNPCSQAADGPATHNMLIVGKDAIFLSHLPMFQEAGAQPMPHRYQAIFEAAFKPEGSDAQLQFSKDRETHRRTKVYTLGPATQFALPGLNDGTLSSFRGTVFRGHLEKLRDPEAFQRNQAKGEGPIFDTEINVTRVVHFREFDPMARKPAELEYILFGRGQELFLAHLIVNPPDFDQILAVKINDHQFPEGQLARGVPLVIPGTVNSAATKLKEKQKATAEIFRGTRGFATVHLNVVSELYFEEGELQLPPIFEQTTREKKAGFP